MKMNFRLTKIRNQFKDNSLEDITGEVQKEMRFLPEIKKIQ